jgi:hypothetical protein
MPRSARLLACPGDRRPPGDRRRTLRPFRWLREELCGSAFGCPFGVPVCPVYASTPRPDWSSLGNAATTFLVVEDDPHTTETPSDNMGRRY